MQASHTDLTKIIEGEKQYVIPLFQRNYSWQTSQWETLWDDLISLCKSPERQSHFLGAIVTMPTTSVPEGVTKYVLIDGQQRLTTVFLLLAAIRDTAPVDDMLGNQIDERFLVNKFSEIDRLRLLPSQQDRTEFRAVMERRLDSDLGQTRLLQCYRYFSQKIKSDSIDLKILMQAITKRLIVVSVVLDANDDPYLVFESLNATGRRLTAADLIRNYLFMRIHTNKQEEINREFWEPMQQRFGGDGEVLTEFIRHYLVRGKAFIKKEDVYATLKEQFRQREVVDGIAELVPQLAKESG